MHHLFTGALVALTATAAGAQTRQCGTVAEVREHLLTKYGESRVEGGVSAGGNFFEWWGNVHEGTWTIVRITPMGIACMVFDGEGWVSFEPVTGDPL